MSLKLWQNAIAAQMAAAGIRNDANESALFARQLEDIAVETYDVLYPELKGRSLCPVYTKVATGAEFHTWRQYDRAGEADEINDYGDDFPGTEIVGAETSSRIVAIGNSYGYSIQDLRNAAFAQKPLDQMKAMAAREIMERKLDLLLAVGSKNAANNSVYGMLNNPNVTVMNPLISAGSGTPYAWITQSTGVRTTKTIKEIVTDVTTWFKAIAVTSNEVHNPDTLVVDVATNQFLKGTLVNADDATIYTGMTLEKLLLQMVPNLRRIESWNRANTASLGSGAHGGTAGKARFAVYESMPRNMSAIIPQEFEQFAPQLRNLKFVINCHMRSGGVVVRYPGSMRYVDGATL